ncbi:MAG: GEVED domain-containing protein [Flavobacteriales bacterium]
MKKKLLPILILIFSVSAFAQQKGEAPQVDTRVDNMGYWKELARQGLVPVQPDMPIEPAVVKSSKINTRSIQEDSPDVPVSATGNDTQSETSIFVNPTNNQSVLNSNNSSGWNGSNIGGVFHGTSYFLSEDTAQTWGGSVNGAGGGNSGDPAVATNLNGRSYIGFIHSNNGQGVSYSDDGLNWTSVVAGAPTGSILDKNHLWVDNSPSSPYEGNIYDAWTDFNNGNDIFIVRSTDDGLTYSSTINLSDAVNAGSHNQGVNIQTGPNGEVYVVWTIYDSWPSDETAIGFAKSTDGGQTYTTGVRAITNIKGIRTSETSKDQRVNSFPSMAVDISGGPNDGALYVVWTNIGEPGTNSGTNRSVYMAKSTDGGSSWATPVRVNQGPFIDGKTSYFPWITCDPESGVLSVIFYDDRDVSSTQCETWVANSYDGGVTWEDFRVSDVAFTPHPISGLAGGYMGDYLGISARGGVVYPVWPDNRNGYVQTWVSPFETNTRPKPTNLQIVLTDATGQTDLTWDFEGASTFQYFVVYRDGVEIGTTVNQNYTDFLPSYGLYQYTVTAMHDDGESSGVNGSIQWGHPDISVSPTSLEETLQPNETSVQVLTITNTGELDLVYDIDTEITSGPDPEADPLAFCNASGGGGDEYISRVQLGTIDNTSGQDFYSDYTALSTDVDAGNTYSITVTNGLVFSADDLGIWIDTNQDQDFDDAGEQVVCTVNDGANGTYNFTVPSDALGGSTRMRIRIKFNGSDCGSPCGTTTWGEVEDYTLNINSWLNVETTSGTIAPGMTENINVHFDSTDLAMGDYFANISINSNANLDPLVIVPVTLHVVEDTVLDATATVDDSNLCNGSSTTLHANPTGGTGTYSYSWTSNPAGFNSTDQNPTVSPTVNTTYTVVVDDGVDTISSSVSVTLVDVPGLPDTPSGEIELCQDAPTNNYTTNDVATATSYVWNLSPSSAGTISGSGTTGTVDWDASFNGTAMINVTASNDCGNGAISNSLSVTINELPTVTLSPFDGVCIDQAPFALYGGDPAGGTYSGPGVSGGNFDPLAAGVGIHTITYAYTNANGCENFATQTIEVFDLPSVNLLPFADVYVNDPPFLLSGGTPIGGIYTGPGVSGGNFFPAVAGIGIHEIVYTYVDDNGCQNSTTQTIEVLEELGVSDVENGVNFNIYPNPNSGSLHLDINSSIINNFEVKIVNQLGTLILTQNIDVTNQNTYTFNLSHLASGLYYFMLNSEQKNYVQKIVVR